MNTPIIDALLGPGTALAFFGDSTKPHTPLSRARLAGPTVRDLIDALRLLDPDTKTSITEVHVECEGGYRRLVPDGHDDEHVASGAADRRAGEGGRRQRRGKERDRDFA